MTLKELEDLVRDKARRLHRIDKVKLSTNTDEKCPEYCRNGVHLGEGEDIRHFYAPTRRKALEDALAWLNKPKRKKNNGKSN